jgi:endonuclease/exonuclease/phosphatase family metal-dependent hydrolase
VQRLRDLHRDASLHAGAPRPGTPRNGPFCAVPRAAPALLAGDFNFLPDSDEYHDLLAPFEPAVQPYRDAWTLRHPLAAHAPTAGLHDAQVAPFTVDFIFASAGLASRVRSVRVMADVGGSGHQPVLIDLDC